MVEAARLGQSATNPDETALLARMQAGDGDAFDACVRTYGGRLLVVARRILGNQEDADDAVQDAFLSAFKGIGQFQGQAQLGTWLHRIVVNAALGRLRSRERRPEQSLEPLLPHFGEGEHQIDPPVPWKATPETTLQNQETRALVQRCIGQLPETYRIALLLRDIEGIATEETAEILGTSTAVVKTRLHRARQALRSLLDPHFRRGDL
jgi:RNA polymerase sigma-70 factor (ECF subfamily)